MAVAIKSQAFQSPYQLAAWAADAANNVTTVISIVTDNSGQYVLFYT